MSLDFGLKCKCCNSYLMSYNITHNLNTMADKCGLYEVLWQPDENGYVKGKDIIDKLETGLKDLKNRPDYYKQFNSKNGWGVYENFVIFVENVLNGCKEYPNFIIEVSR